MPAVVSAAASQHGVAAAGPAAARAERDLAVLAVELADLAVRPRAEG